MWNLIKSLFMYLVLKEQEEVEATQLGYISDKYESGEGRLDAGTVADNANDPGGKSYGVYQLSSRAGTLKRYLQTSRYGELFEGYTPGSPAFDEIWKKTAIIDQEAFALDQLKFIIATHYKPASEFAITQGFDLKYRAIQEAIFSISVQHGGYKKVIRAARHRKDGKTLRAQVRALYGARKAYVNGLRLHKAIKAAIFSRYVDEERDVLELADKELIE